MNEMPDYSQSNPWQNELLTVPEVAAYLGVTQVTVGRWCQRGIIRACRVDHCWRIYRDDLLGLLNSPAPHYLESIRQLPSPDTSGQD
jgi:excisionase family DNA binding protein